VERTAAPFHEWVAAVAPTGRLLEMATLLEKAAPNITETASALQLHPDRGHKKQDAKRRNSHVPHSHMERNVDLDGVDIDLLVETDRHVYVVEVKTRPKIADVGALLAKCDVAQQKLGKPAIPILTGVMIGREVEAYARGKGVRIMKL
jgi:hypothetical protein